MNYRTILCRLHLLTSTVSAALLAILVASCVHTEGNVTKLKTNPKKLKVVLLMGQSNMVGYSQPLSAWYLTQPLYVPPPKVATAKGQTYEQGGFYWEGVSLARGDSEEYNAKGPALIAERRASRNRWRSLVWGNRKGERNDWKEEYGPLPELGTKNMYPFLQKKAAEEGIYKRMVEHIESPENKLHPTVAIKLIDDRDNPIADDIKRVRNLFLKGTKPQDFDGLSDAIKEFGRITPTNRLDYAKMVRAKVNLPIADRTYISAYGEVSGEPTEIQHDKITQGLLSLGYTKWPTACGPEYPFGISFETLVDGPALVIKCAWGGTSLDSNWRPPSLSTKEKPTGRLFEASLDHIRNVLADPGKYHPDYDPKAGYEVSGLVWFQGWNDSGNKAYGEQLVHFIKDWRKELKAPDMKVVCGLLGHGGLLKEQTFKGDVNSGMLYASKHPDLKGTVDIVNTKKYFPYELGLLSSVKMAYGEDSDEYKKADFIIRRASGKPNDGCHYFGAAKFIYLTGDAMARKLANLMAGGEPTIHKEAEEILGDLQ